MLRSTAAIERLRPRTVVAIPAKDEEDRIAGCLAALARQDQVPDIVLLLLNNCTDSTEAIARSLAPSLPFELMVVCRELPPAQVNAGQARRIAMALAAEQAGLGGVLLTTDADGIVGSDWIRRNVTALKQGADLVCGRAVINQAEASIIPAHLHDDDARECELLALLDEMAWRVDPDPHDPPPRHTEASGASLAVTVAAFDRIGGIPPLASGEDRAFVAALRRIDARIRHDPTIKVEVSGRIIGRAAGGMADAIRRRIVRQDEYTDESVEPAHKAMQRLSLRSQARAAWERGGADHALAGNLGMDAIALSSALTQRFFGAAWLEIEGRSPILRRERVRFVDLPAEIMAAKRILSLLLPGAVAAE